MNPAQATPPPTWRPLILIVDFEALAKATVMGPDVIVMDVNLTKPCYPDALADEIRRVLRGWRRSH